jgi:hypothetical protein
LSELIIRAMSAEGLDADEDDERADDLLALFFGGQARNLAAFVPFAGPAALAGVNAFNDKWYDDRISTSPAVSVMESSVRAPHSVYTAMTDPDRSKKRAIRDTLTLLGVLSGWPLAPAGRPLGYLADVQAGEAEPEGTADLVRGLVTGR